MNNICGFPDIVQHITQVEKSDERSCSPDVRSYNPNEILQASDKKSSSLKSCIKSYCIFFEDRTCNLFSIQICSDILRRY